MLYLEHFFDDNDTSIIHLEVRRKRNQNYRILPHVRGRPCVSPGWGGGGGGIAGHILKCVRPPKN